MNKCVLVSKPFLKHPTLYWWLHSRITPKLLFMKLQNLWLVLLLLVCCGQLSAQRVLLIEKINSPTTQKLYAGDYIQYRLVDDEDWYRGDIYELREDAQLIVFEDRYVPIDQVEMFRRGKPWATAVGTGLTTFGISWSFFALVGTATDGNPDTSYRASDAVVSGISLGLGFLIPRLFGRQKLRFGEGRKYRLRIIDVSF